MRKTSTRQGKEGLLDEKSSTPFCGMQSSRMLLVYYYLFSPTRNSHKKKGKRNYPYSLLADPQIIQSTTDAVMSQTCGKMSEIRCAYCHSSDGKEFLLHCKNCRTLLHRECAAELIICPTLGCETHFLDGCRHIVTTTAICMYHNRVVTRLCIRCGRVEKYWCTSCCPDWRKVAWREKKESLSGTGDKQSFSV